MRVFLLLMVSFLLASCSKQVTYLKYDFLPNKINVDSVFYNPPKMTDLKLEDHSFIAINGGIGKVCADDSCKIMIDSVLPSGVLFSDKAAYEYRYLKIVFPSMIQRMSINKDLFKSYQDNVYKIDSLYNNKIVELEKEKERTWLEKNSIFIGFFLGAVSAIIIEFGTNQVK